MGRGGAADFIQEQTGQRISRGKGSNEALSRRVGVGDVGEVKCQKTGDQFNETWSCSIDGRREGYARNTARFDELDISGAEVEQFNSEDGNEMVIFDYPSGGECQVRHQPVQQIDQERTLICR